MEPLVPTSLLAAAERGPEWADWLDRLPRLATDLLTRWRLTRTDAPRHGHTALVLPVTTDDGAAAMLKIGFDGDDESEHEALALQHWQGRGAVRMLRADPGRRALLLERLGEADLSQAWDLEACEIVAGLYGALHRPALPRLPTLTSYVERWADALRTLPPGTPLPRRLVEQALALVPDLVSADEDLRIVHGDLHYRNVLAADREPWLAIDPKPMAGDPHYEPAPMLWNRWQELSATPGGVRDGLRRRFHTLVDVADLDEDRARDWVVVRMVLNAHWTIQHADRGRRAPTPREQEWITRCVTLAKAVQD